MGSGISFRYRLLISGNRANWSNPHLHSCRYDGRYAFSDTQGKSCTQQRDYVWYYIQWLTATRTTRMVEKGTCTEHGHTPVSRPLYDRRLVVMAWSSLMRFSEVALV